MRSFFSTLFGVAAFMSAASASAQTNVPDPVLRPTGQQSDSVRGTAFIRYGFEVTNRDEFPAEMFAAAPNLPPCGRNANASRSWVDIYDRTGRRLYGFCAIASPQALDTIWFNLPESQLPPSYVYIVITDRQTNRTYRSNLAETTP